jgi:prepilin signal peptidase PulO-like enzyme (type II secretory pathway)
MTSEITDSIKEWFDQRIKSTYFASVIFVWLIYNRTIVAGILFFDDHQTWAQKMVWVSAQFQAKTICLDFWRLTYPCYYFISIPGFWVTVFLAVIRGFLAMFVFIALHALGKAFYKWLNRKSIAFLKSVSPSDYIEIKEHDKKIKELSKTQSELTEIRGQASRYTVDLKSVQDTLKIREEEVARLEHESTVQTALSNKQVSDIQKLEEKISELTTGQRSRYNRMMEKSYSVMYFMKGNWRSELLDDQRFLHGADINIDENGFSESKGRRIPFISLTAKAQTIVASFSRGQGVGVKRKWLLFVETDNILSGFEVDDEGDLRGIVKFTRIEPVVSEEEL